MLMMIYVSKGGYITFRSSCPKDALAILRGAQAVLMGTQGVLRVAYLS